MQNKTKPLALLTLAFAFLIGGSAFRAAADAPTPSRIAVVDIVTVFSRLDEKKDGDAEIEKLGKEISAEKAKKEDTLKLLSQGLEHPAFKPDSPDYKNQQEQVLQASMDLQVFLAVSEQKLLLMQRMKTETIYRSMNAAIKKYAEENGIALVFVIDDADLSAARDVKELTSRIAMRKVLYAHPNYDITAAIVEKMNSTAHPTPR